MAKRSKSGIAIIILIVALSAAGALLVLMGTQRFGVGMSPDSLVYLSTAKSLINGKGYVIHDGSAVTNWPPLYPTLLAIIGLTGLSLLDAARYLNVVLFGLIIFVSGLWLRKNIESLPLVVLGCLAVLFAQPLLSVSLHAWSELTFILLVLLFVMQMQRFLETGKLPPLILSAIIAAALFATRYAGYSVVLSGILLLLLAHNRRSLRERLLNATVFGLIAVLPMAPWFAKNYAISSTLTGQRHASIQPLAESASHAVYTVACWLMPSQIPIPPRILIARALLIMLTVLWTIVARRRRESDDEGVGSAAAVLAWVLLVYVVLLVISASRVATDPIDNRLMSPAYVPLMLMIPLAIQALRSRFGPHSAARTAGAVMAVLFGLWLTYPAYCTAHTVRACRRDGAGRYLKAAWNDSRLTSYLKSKPLNGPVYSNSPEAAYILAGIGAKLSPTAPKRPTPKMHSPSLAEFKSAIKAKGAYLVWFSNDNYRPWLHPLPEIRSVCNTKLLFRGAGGSVYMVRLRPAR